MSIEIFWSDTIPEYRGKVQDLSPEEMKLARNRLLVLIEQVQNKESEDAYVIICPKQGGQFAIENNLRALESFFKMVQKNYPKGTWSKSHKGSCALRGKDKLPPEIIGKNNYGRGRWA